MPEDFYAAPLPDAWEVIWDAAKRAGQSVAQPFKEIVLVPTINSDLVVAKTFGIHQGTRAPKGCTVEIDFNSQPESSD